jgi:hypothetical protein
MYELTRLTAKQVSLCEKTISSNTFYMLVGDALISKKDLSVVRMGDGEVRLYQDVAQGGEEILSPTPRHNQDWLQKLGVLNIPKGLLKQRLHSAANGCTYFAPSISGIWRTDYDNHGLSYRQNYVDNFFVNAWTPEMIVALFRQAGHVLLIHANAETADAMQINSQNKLGVKVSFLKMTSWEQSESVVQAAHKIDAPLVLFSAGPGGKYIGPAISDGRGKVALDLGNSVDGWTLSNI